jgi:hypothetical protein
MIIFGIGKSIPALFNKKKKCKPQMWSACVIFKYLVSNNYKFCNSNKVSC